jgi:hypothetical protein
LRFRVTLPCRHIPGSARQRETDKRCLFWVADISRFDENGCKALPLLFEPSMNWIIINLALAVFWLFLGTGILVVERMRGQSLFGPVIISPGWLALVLAVYNTIRVVTMWKYAQEQRRIAEEEREAAHQQFLQRPVEVVHPEFRITEEKPAAEKTEDRG